MTFCSVCIAVLQATCRISGTPVALKVYRMKKLSDLSRYQVYREISVHAGLNHPNIVQLYAAFQVSADTRACTQSPERMAQSPCRWSFQVGIEYMHSIDIAGIGGCIEAPSC